MIKSLIWGVGVSDLRATDLALSPKEQKKRSVLHQVILLTVSLLYSFYVV